MKINWVDDTHALGVFSSDSAGKRLYSTVKVAEGFYANQESTNILLCAAALHALSICHPLLKARTLAEGSKKSRGKAFRQAGRT